MNAKQITYPLRDRWSYLWLVIGTAMTLFSTGQWTIPLWNHLRLDLLGYEFSRARAAGGTERHGHPVIAQHGIPGH